MPWCAPVLSSSCSPYPSNTFSMLPCSTKHCCRLSHRGGCLATRPLFAASSGCWHETWRHRSPSGSTRRSVAEVQGTQRRLACCCCAPFETQHQRAYRTSALRPRAHTHPPIVVTVASRFPVLLRDSFINRIALPSANHSSPGYAGGLCFDSPASRAALRFARHRSSFACTTRRPSTGDCAQVSGELPPTLQ